VEDLFPLIEPVEENVGHGIIGEDLAPLAADAFCGDPRRLPPIGARTRALPSQEVPK
jgi:hypothetical protein